jgi:hypothetical protein
MSNTVRREFALAAGDATPGLVRANHESSKSQDVSDDRPAAVTTPHARNASERI